MMESLQELVKNVWMFLEYFSLDIHAIVQFLLSFFTLERIIQGIVIYFFLLWGALIFWVTRDVLNRSESILFQIFSIFLVIFWTPLWVFLYLLIRPQKEIAIKEEEGVYPVSNDVFSKKISFPCPRCKGEVFSEHSFCPHCGYAVKKVCIFCNKEIKWEWKHCPYCGGYQEKHKKSLFQRFYFQGHTGDKEG